MNSPASTELGTPTASTPSPLQFERLQSVQAALASQLLGGRVVGEALEALQAPMLLPEGTRFDAWLTSGKLEQHHIGCVSYVTDGTWLYGRAELDESPSHGMQTITQRAYADVFAALAESPCPHLLRVWNYFAHINEHAGGTERYRQFNAGRQMAFLDAQRSAFDGSPAACALGTHGGPLQVSFLSGRTAPLAIENPRQVSAYRYPDSYGPRAPTFSRAALADVGGGQKLLFVSGTAAIVGHQSLHPGDVRRQTEESLININTVREAAEMQSGLTIPGNDMYYTIYVRSAADLPAIREVFEQAVGPNSKAARDAVYLNADICRAELLVEIEAHGLAAARGTV